MNRLTHTFRAQREHARHAKGGIIGRDERAPDARRKILVVRSLLDHPRRDEDLGNARYVGELAEMGIELRIGSQASIVLGDLVLSRRTPDAGNDESLFGVDFVGNWQGCSVRSCADSMKLLQNAVNVVIGSIDACGPHSAS